MSRPRAARQIDAARNGHFLRESEEVRNRGHVFPPARSALEKRPVLVETPVRAAFEAKSGANGFDDSGHDFPGIDSACDDLCNPVLDREPHHGELALGDIPDSAVEKPLWVMLRSADYRVHPTGQPVSCDDAVLHIAVLTGLDRLLKDLLKYSPVFWVNIAQE